MVSRLSLRHLVSHVLSNAQLQRFCEKPTLSKLHLRLCPSTMAAPPHGFAVLSDGSVAMGEGGAEMAQDPMVQLLMGSVMGMLKKKDAADKAAVAAKVESENKNGAEAASSSQDAAAEGVVVTELLGAEAGDQEQKAKKKSKKKSSKGTKK